jgi:FkbM family methyltransferase
MTTEPITDAIEAQARLLEAAGRSAQHIIDGGAFVGDMTARYLERFAGAHLWVFEPTPAMVEGLRGRFGNESRVTVIPAAISDRNGRMRFVLNEAPATNSLLAFEPASAQNLDYAVQTVGEVEVEAVTLDAFCRHQGIEALSIVKLDVQGAALEVAVGAEDLLTRSAIDLYFTELAFVPVYEGQTAPGGLLGRLGHFGYRLYDLYNIRRAPSGQFKWCDALFTSPELRRRAAI